MFNIQKSDQENIVQNNIQNTIKNRSINTQDTTVASNIVCDEAQTIIVNAGFCGLTDKMTYPDGTEKIIQHQCSGGSTCNYNVENVSDCEQTDNLELNILSKTDTSFDTSVSNNISNELKSHKQKVIINCASNEYFKSISNKFFEGSVITPEFKEIKNGTMKMISFYAKKARGMMARYIIDNRIDSSEKILSFNLDGYSFNPSLSSKMKPVFTRNQS